MSDFRPGLSTQAEMSTAYKKVMKLAAQHVHTLTLAVENAVALENPHWANVGDAQHLLAELDNAMNAIKPESGITQF